MQWSGPPLEVRNEPSACLESRNGHRAICPTSCQIMATVPSFPAQSGAPQTPNCPQGPHQSPLTTAFQAEDLHSSRPPTPPTRPPTFAFPEIPNRPLHSSSSSNTGITIQTTPPAPLSPSPLPPSETSPTAPPSLSKYMLQLPQLSTPMRGSASQRQRHFPPAYTLSTPQRPPTIALTVHTPECTPQAQDAQTTPRSTRSLPLLQTPTRPSTTQLTARAPQSLPRPRAQLTIPSLSLPRPSSAVPQPHKKARTVAEEPPTNTESVSGMDSASSVHTAEPNGCADRPTQPALHEDNTMEVQDSNHSQSREAIRPLEAMEEDSFREPLMTSTQSTECRNSPAPSGERRPQEEGDGEANVSFGTLMAQHTSSNTSPVFNFGWFDGGADGHRQQWQQQGFGSLIHSVSNCCCARWSACLFVYYLPQFHLS